MIDALTEAPPRAVTVDYPSKWEYQVVKVVGSIVEVLDTVGRDGWEVCVTIGQESDGSILFLVKRPTRLIQAPPTALVLK